MTALKVSIRNGSIISLQSEKGANVTKMISALFLETWTLTPKQNQQPTDRFSGVIIPRGKVLRFDKRPDVQISEDNDIQPTKYSIETDCQLVSSSSSAVSPGVIFGPVAIGLIVIIALLVVVFVRRRRQIDKVKQDDDNNFFWILFLHVCLWAGGYIDREWDWEWENKALHLNDADDIFSI